MRSWPWWTTGSGGCLLPLAAAVALETARSPVPPALGLAALIGVPAAVVPGAVGAFRDGPVGRWFAALFALVGLGLTAVGLAIAFVCHLGGPLMLGP